MSFRNALVPVLLVALLVTSGHAAPKTARPKTVATANDLFADRSPVLIEITLTDQAVATLRKAQWQFGQNSEREGVNATVREGTNTYSNVTLHLKGAAGSFRSFDDKPALTLHFGKGQHFHGLSKLSLNNSVQDPTFVSEQLCRELFNKAGVPAPRAAHAWVVVNGRDLGLYVLTEGWDREFLKRHFKNTKGNLYDGGFLKDVTDELTVNSGESPSNQSDRTNLVAAVSEKDLTNRLAKLERVLDLDRFITFVALDIMLWDWDGYAMNRNNWRLYHDLDTGRMVFMPHGMDQMFWNPKGSVFPPMQGLVARSVLDIPSLRQRYFERMKELRHSLFQADALTNRAQQIAATFTPMLKEKASQVFAEQERTLRDLCDAMALRTQSLDQQLAHPVKPIEFDGSGYAHLTEWESKTDFGFPSLTESADGSSRVLKIATDKGSSIGSWRTSLWLERGEYRVEAKLRTKGIVADPGDPRGGAGLRSDKAKPANYRLGDSDWKAVDYSISVPDALTQVQVIYEFRGAQGEAWLDVNSMRLKRVSAQP